MARARAVLSQLTAVAITNRLLFAQRSCFQSLLAECTLAISELERKFPTNKQWAVRVIEAWAGRECCNCRYGAQAA